jgi:hypothetical protein
VGINTQVALNFSYERVEVTVMTRIEVPLVGSTETVCLASYEEGRFVRVE